MMKRIAGAIAFATLTATVASAATMGPPNRTAAEVTPNEYRAQHLVAAQPGLGYAAADEGLIVGTAGAVASDPSWVVEGGKIVGRDPDLNVRLQLEKDAAFANY